MAISMHLPKEDNVLYFDFPAAYWVIENIHIYNDNDGIGNIDYDFNAYPSREARKKNLQSVESTMLFGGAVGIAYCPILHHFQNTVRTTDVFPNGIPVSSSEQKNALYAFTKQYCGLTDYEDVLEDEDI
jgi:hypothetical protein